MLKILKTIIERFYPDYTLISYQELWDNEVEQVEIARANIRQELLDEKTTAKVNRYKAQMAKIFEAKPVENVVVRKIKQQNYIKSR